MGNIGSAWTGAQEVVIVGPAEGEIARSHYIADESSLSLIALTGLVIEDSRAEWRSVYDALPGGASSAPCLGQWMAVAEDVSNPGDYFVYADPFGFQPVFWSSVRGSSGRTSLVVAPTFRALSSYLGRAGHAADWNVDWDCFYMHLFSRHMLLTTSASTHTFDSRIRILRHNEAFRLSGERISIVSRPRRSDSSGEYRAVLDRGIEEASSVVRAGANVGAQRSLLYLSGGKDSRAVLAMMSATGAFDRYSIRTANPASHPEAWGREMLGADLRIADVLRRRFDMEWWTTPESWRLEAPFAASLEIWQRFNSNWNFNADVAPSRMVAKKFYGALRGGGGELLRSTNVAQALGSSTTPDSMSASSFEVANRIVTYADIARRLAPGSLGILEDELGQSSLGVSVEGINEFYGAHRNRAHFGQARKSYWAGELSLLPLASPSLHAAALMLEPGQREAGRLIYDLVQATTPILNRIPFAGSAWEPGALGLPRLPKVFSESECVDYRSFEQALAREASGIRSAEVVGVAGASDHRALAVSANRAAMSFIRQAFALLLRNERTAVPELPEVARRVLYLTAEGGLRPVETAAKLASLLDVGFCEGASPLPLRVGHWGGVCDDSFGERLLSISESSAPHYRWACIELRVAAEVDGDQVTVSVAPSGDDSIDLEFAFYLMVGGRRAQARWYSGSRTVEFREVDARNESLAVKVFARIVGGGDIIAQADVPLEVDAM